MKLLVGVMITSSLEGLRNIAMGVSVCLSARMSQEIRVYMLAAQLVEGADSVCHVTDVVQRMLTRKLMHVDLMLLMIAKRTTCFAVDRAVTVYLDVFSLFTGFNITIVSSSE